MPTDLPPRKTLVMLFRSLQYAQSDLERREIVRAARVVRQALRATSSSTRPGELSPLAQRILSKCAGQTLSIKVIARACGGMSHDGTPIKRAMRELLASKKIERVGKGMYHVAQSNSQNHPGKNPAPIASK